MLSLGPPTPSLCTCCSLFLHPHPVLSSVQHVGPSGVDVNLESLLCLDAESTQRERNRTSGWGEGYGACIFPGICLVSVCFPCDIGSHPQCRSHSQRCTSSSPGRRLFCIPNRNDPHHLSRLTQDRPCGGKFMSGISLCRVTVDGWQRQPRSTNVAGGRRVGGRCGPRAHRGWGEWRAAVGTHTQTPVPSTESRSLMRFRYLAPSGCSQRMDKIGGWTWRRDRSWLNELGAADWLTRCAWRPQAHRQRAGLSRFLLRDQVAQGQGRRQHLCPSRTQCYLCAKSLLAWKGFRLIGIHH